MTAAPPYTLIAELTYRCPLRCAYCSNPVDLAAHPDRLGTADWARVFQQAEALGVLQVHLTGGEPLVRRDLVELVAAATENGLYASLITSGVGATRDRVQALASAGLAALQLSIQDVDAEASRAVAGGDWLDQKLRVAAWAREAGLPLTLNVVLHRGNIERTDRFITLAETLGADRVELANTQYLGWALVNRGALMPTPEQLASARQVAERERKRLRGRMEVVFVLPDYYAGAPKACMDGWGRRYVVVSPDGLALPCHLAHTLPIRFGSVLETSLFDLWQGQGFAAFRGEAWMSETCASCDMRAVDFGGCRCQAYHLLGDARATDPACARSPRHAVVTGARATRFDMAPASIVRRAKAPVDRR